MLPIILPNEIFLPECSIHSEGIALDSNDESMHHLDMV